MDILSARKRNKPEQKAALPKPNQIQFGWVFKLHIIIAVIIIFCVPQGTNASISISAGDKSWFIFEVKAGSRIDSKAVLINGENRPIDIKIYPVDAEENKKTGAFLTGNYDPNGPFEKWMMAPKNITIKPLSKEELTFSISIPDDTPSGEYIGALMAEEKNEGDESISINTRVGVRIYVTVKNDKPQQPQPVKMETAETKEPLPIIEKDKKESIQEVSTPETKELLVQKDLITPESPLPEETKEENNISTKENISRDSQTFPVIFLIGAATAIAGLAIGKKLRK